MPSDAFEQRLLADLQQLVRPRHARWDALSLLAVRSFIREQLETCGPVELQTFEEGPDAGVNLILKLPGRNLQLQLQPVLVGAHYDGPLNSPGADDNATGEAALLELARRWSASPPERPLWLVAFDKEEWGMLGSGALAKELRSLDQPLHLMVSLEMLGYTSEMRQQRCSPSVARPPQCDGSPCEHQGPACSPRGQLMSEVRLSDHSPFWDAGYNAMMVTDTSFMRNPNYHEASDTIDTLDLPFLMSVIDGLEIAIGGLA